MKKVSNSKIKKKAELTKTSELIHLQHFRKTDMNDHSSLVLKIKRMPQQNIFNKLVTIEKNTPVMTVGLMPQLLPNPSFLK